MQKYLLAFVTVLALSSFTCLVSAPGSLASILVGTWEVREITTRQWDQTGKLEKEDIEYPTSSIHWTFSKNKLKFQDGTSTGYTVDAKTQKVAVSDQAQSIKVITSSNTQNYIDWKTTKVVEGKKVEQTFGLLKLQ
ncbi:hypothetical protein TH63_02230 [Rufibacter radiotolerans]|uniref:Lipocalin-like domain-containing protein n=1 Tax=Rufibacter radiotolerans TaxID=1379910 RepID=A0A0H4VLV5_9BACT|nr:hypothetical protein [Rufibacter radiotolerans]AKQ44709.1 hypothetical protein TH63_02230 [Rufibacter radiotolerans]